MLRDVARQAGDLLTQLAECAPARREQLAIHVRKAERLPYVPDRAPRPIRRERRDERRVLAPVALSDGDDQLLPDVAREIEVDVRHGVELTVEETTEREIRAHRIDVREAGQIAHERTDRGAATATRRQDVPG